jgi:hypothetical protein
MYKFGCKLVLYVLLRGATRDRQSDSQTDSQLSHGVTVIAYSLRRGTNQANPSLYNTTRLGTEHFLLVSWGTQFLCALPKARRMNTTSLAMRHPSPPYSIVFTSESWLDILTAGSSHAHSSTVRF